MSKKLKLLGLTAALLAVLAGCAHPTSADVQTTDADTTAKSDVRQDVIAVQAEGSAAVKPELATLRAEFSVTGENAKTAKETGDKTLEGTLNALNALGVKQEAVKSDYQLSGVYQDKDGVRTRTSYRALYQLDITVNDLEKLFDYIEALDNAKAELKEIVYATSDPADLEEQAVKNAIAAAEKQAQSAADAAGVKLGEPMSVECLELAQEGTESAGEVTAYAGVRVAFSIQK